MDVQVKYGDDPRGYAAKLLKAARKLEKSSSVVQFSPDGHYVVPEEVADEAGVSYDMLDDGDQSTQEARQKPQEPADGDADASVDQEPDEEPHAPPGPRSEADEAEAEDAPDPEPEPKQEVEVPKKNLSRDVWVDFAKSQGAPDEETKPQDEGGLSRADLIKKYAPKE